VHLQCDTSSTFIVALIRLSTPKPAGSLPENGSSARIRRKKFRAKKAVFATRCSADAIVQSAAQKFHFRFSENYDYLPPSRLDAEGVLAKSSPNVRRGCDGREDGARRAPSARTAKSCGPDTPTLVSSSLRFTALANDGGKKARFPGEITYKP
jgi:hypothetical protein